VLLLFFVLLEFFFLDALGLDLLRCLERAWKCASGLLPEPERELPVRPTVVLRDLRDVAAEATAGPPLALRRTAAVPAGPEEFSVLGAEVPSRRLSGCRLFRSPPR